MNLTSPIGTDKNIPITSNPWGFDMRGIRPKGACPVPGCKNKFEYDSQRGFICPEHLTEPRRYRIAIRYKGDLIRRETDLDGNTLVTFAQAHALLAQISKEKRDKTLDLGKWRNSVKSEYEFMRLVYQWYEEKERLMAKGKRAPSYVPKLKTYIEHYFKFFKDQDVREIRTSHIKDFANELPGMSLKVKELSLKYQKNIMDALESFFNWLLEDERLIRYKPKFPSIEVPEHDFKTINPDIQASILEFIPLEHRSIFVFLFNQGCRPSEARALKWDCIDLDEQVVTFKRTFSDSKLLERTKTKQIRHNFLFPETLDALPPRGFPAQYVFTHGKRVKRNYSKNHVNRLFNEALNKFNQHMRDRKLRWQDIDISLYEATKHSFGSRYYKEGVSLDLLQKHFGHSKKDSTLRYTKVDVVEAFRNVIALRNRRTHHSEQ